ncbi:hypothetical protein IFR04_000017 [Cadophora malorum]|uniref:Uncharacterized protein n=1 Tax=Cadophora malorum TaxID=108018 RepID=A0A8H7WKY0_9HELO|nr:hypothetical protein IFR04_000017 [Cadophora malorum]
MSTSWKEKLGFKPAVVEPPAKLTPEEEKAERKRERKERMANAKKEQDKKDKKLQKRIDHANSSAGVYTQFYKKENGDVSWWKLFLYS